MVSLSHLVHSSLARGISPVLVSQDGLSGGRELQKLSIRTSTWTAHGGSMPQRLPRVILPSLSLGGTRIRASASPPPEPSSSASAEKGKKLEEDEEARVEAFESRLRSGSGGGAAKASVSSRRDGSAQPATGQRAEWKKGSLFPEGWEQMDPLEKATELYLGERGILFWSTQLTIGGLAVLVVAWIVFRFVGPSLGLYALENDPNL
jgi:hypothetical protein